MRIKTFLFTLSLFVSFADAAFASCDSCLLPRIGRSEATSLGADRAGFFFDFGYEMQDWRTKSFSGVVHEDSAHAHNKSFEKFYHLGVGANIGETFTLSATMPFVERAEMREEGKEVSEGFGDLRVLGIWRAHRFSQGFLGLVGGIKAPTGETNERDSDEVRFEPEMQPGSGSWDTTVGALAQVDREAITLRGNILYTLKSEGDQDYEFGDSLSAAFFADYMIDSEGARAAYLGIDTTVQYSDKDKKDGRNEISSGGTVLTVGPNLTLRFSEKALFSSAVLFPVYQDRGGEHQESGSTWMNSLRVIF